MEGISESNKVIVVHRELGTQTGSLSPAVS